MPSLRTPFASCGERCSERFGAQSRRIIAGALKLRSTYQRDEQRRADAHDDHHERRDRQERPASSPLGGSTCAHPPPAQLELLPPCGAEMAGALEGHAIDVAWLCSTQPIIAQNGWLVLADDLDTQPAENLAPIVRNDWLDRVDGGTDAIAAILDPISATITTDVLTELGVRIAVDQESIEDVAAEYLASLAG